MVRVGIVGVGFMGMIHYLAYQKVRGAKVGAICSRDKKKLAGDWRGIQGNFGPPGTKMDLGDIGRYEHWEQLLDDPNIDLVDICLPPKLHAAVAVAALRAGKHVLCEKPIALTIADAERMVRAARQNGRQLLIAQVLPFMPEYAFVRKLAESGQYGRPIGGHFKRIISAPQWIADFYEPDVVGGPVVDLHIHDAHFIRLLWGMPESVRCVGRPRQEVIEFMNSHFVFADRTLMVTATSGVIPQQGRSFTHGFEIYFEGATLLYDFSVLDGQPTTSMPLTLLTSTGKVTQPKLKEADAFELELTEAVGAVHRNKPSPLLAGELALDALAICQKESISAWRGKPIKIGR